MIGRGLLSSAIGRPDEDQVDDVRELMGLRTVAAAAMVGFFIFTFAVVGAMTAAPGGLWAETVGWLLVSSAAVALIRAPYDPLPLPWTWFIAAAGPLATVVVLVSLEIPFGTKLALWPLSATTALATFLCVRGRTPVAWVSLVGAIVVCVAWAEQTGQGAGVGLMVGLPALAPLLMATFFALSIRPAAADIFALRRSATAAIAEEAAHGAVLEERDRQLERLDAQARPLLERLTAAGSLSDADRRTCALVEARLRDSLRAPLLDVPDVREAAWSARARDVEVVLLDDHGMDRAEPAVRRRITGAVADVLATAADGSVTVRILPPGRSVLATVLQSAEDRIVRAEYDRDGYPVVAAPLGGDR